MRLPPARALSSFLTTGKPPLQGEESDGRADTQGELDALEIIAAELAKLRMLREYEIGAEVREVEGNRYVQPIEK
jgi:hypothetical protein